MPAPEISREDAAAALAARRELGEELEPAVVDAFVERVERAIDARVEQRVAERNREHGAGDSTVGVALGSLALAIPLTAIASGLEDGNAVLATIIVWISIVIINVAHARRRH